MPGVSGLGECCGSISELDSSDESSEDEDEDDEDASLGSIGIFWALTLTGIVTVRWTSDADESESDSDDEEDEDDEATRLLRFRVRFLAAGSLEDGPAMGRGEVMGVGDLLVGMAEEGLEGCNTRADDGEGGLALVEGGVQGEGGRGGV